ncbi:MAG: replicative DNA helicase [Salinivirgaceae bacterium]|nr:replicative DNA helicase [Salinivirgaceae bacterium]
MAKKFTPAKVEPTESLFAGTGKVPPQAIDFEESVLGALMLENDAFLQISEILKPEHFYKEEHGKIFDAIARLSAKQTPIDINTVAQRLKIDKELDTVGGPSYLAYLTNRIASTAHIEFHARVIAQKYVQRELIRIGAEMQRNGFEDVEDVQAMLDSAEQNLFELTTGNVKRDVQSMAQVVGDAYTKLLDAKNRDDGMVGVPSGFTALDNLTLGWQPSDLVIVAARPAMGKTAFVLSMAKNMAVDRKIPVAFFTLEMSSVQLVNRIISSTAEVPSSALKSGRVSEEQWNSITKNIKPLESAPMFIDETPALSISEFRSKIKRLKKLHDIQIAIIDYLQLMSAGTNVQSREQEVSTISRNLKAIAKEVNIPIIALSQLSRNVEQRGGDKRPQLSDLRESGAIEQDADMVIFIHRPEYYGIKVDENGNSLIGVAQIIVAKHRNGAVDDVTLQFKSEFTRFCDFESLGGLQTTQTYHSKMNSTAATQPAESAPAASGSDFKPNTDFDAQTTPSQIPMGISPTDSVPF